MATTGPRTSTDEWRTAEYDFARMMLTDSIYQGSFHIEILVDTEWRGSTWKLPPHC